jgi:hypothetical protein
MKLRIVMPLVLSAAALTGCQQLNDGVNTVNGAISSSLSSVGKALGELPPQSLGPVSSVSGLGAVCKDYEENAMAAEKKWTGKRISITNATVLEVTKGRSASDMMTGMPKQPLTITFYLKPLIPATAADGLAGLLLWY